MKSHKCCECGLNSNNYYNQSQEGEIYVDNSPAKYAYCDKCFKKFKDGGRVVNCSNQECDAILIFTDKFEFKPHERVVCGKCKKSVIFKSVCCGKITSIGPDTIRGLTQLTYDKKLRILSNIGDKGVASFVNSYDQIFKCIDFCDECYSQKNLKSDSKFIVCPHCGRFYITCNYFNLDAGKTFKCLGENCGKFINKCNNDKCGKIYSTNDYKTGELCAECIQFFLMNGSRGYRMGNVRCKSFFEN